MTDTRFFAILAAMTAAAISVSAYDIDLEPDAAKRRTVTVFKSQGPQTASLYLKAPSPWVIAGSAITAPSGPESKDQRVVKPEPAGLPSSLACPIRTAPLSTVAT